MSRIFIHAGTPKTGTTALQEFLPKNQAVLNKYGYAFPEVPFYFRGVSPHQTAHFLAMWENGEPVSKEWDEGFEIMRKALLSHENIIFSDEQVWWRQHKDGFWEEVMKRVESMGAELYVVVYLRRQDLQVESFYNEKVKGMPKLTCTFFEYISGGMNDYFPLNYATELDRFASYIGKEHLIVRTYEKGHFIGGNIFSDFLNAVGLSLTDEYVLPNKNPNTRWPEHVVEAKRHANAAISYHKRKVPNFYRDAIETAYGIGESDKLPEQKLGMFSLDERRDFMQKYEEGNAYVARNYLGRPDGVLFYEDLGDFPKWIPEYKLLREDSIRMLSGADTLIFERQDRLERDVGDFLREIDDCYDGMILRSWRAIKRLLKR